MVRPLDGVGSSPRTGMTPGMPPMMPCPLLVGWFAGGSDSQAVPVRRRFGSQAVPVR